MLGMMARKPIPQDIVDAWTAPGIADKEIRRDLIKYCRTRFDGTDLIRATNSLKDFSGPALVLWSRNRVMPAEHGDRLAALLPEGQLRHIDDAYVLVMLDQPEQTARAIGEFLTA
jgi:pimeloyl-ACP methyl ester carboxylesterase